MSNDFPAPPEPADDLQALDHLVGTWQMSGGAEGTVRYEWMDGGYFLVQHVELQQFGQQISGLEMIGHLRPFGDDRDPEIRSRFYDSTGNTLDYVYEPSGDTTLTIWGGEKGSPAYCETVLSDDRATLTSTWTYPGGGGYQTTGTKVE